MDKKDWKMVRLGDVFKFQKKSKIKAGEGKEKGVYPFYTSSEVLSKYLDDYQEEGDSLIFGTGGKASIHYNSEKFSVSTDCFVVKPMIESVFTKYVYYYLSGNIHILEEGFKGAGLKHISKEYISNIQIPIPPLSIQREVVERLDRAAALHQKDKELLTAYDDLAQATFIDLFGDPITNPMGWEVDSFGNKFRISSGGTPNTKIKKYWENGTISWIGSNMCQNNILYQNDGKFITQLGLENSSAKIFDEGTILVALVGATIGKIALLKFSTSTNQNIAGIQIIDKEKYNSIFVYYLLQNLYHKFMELGNGGFKMANLTFIRNLPLLSPPISLQEKFAKIIENIEQQKAHAKQQMEQSENLFLSLLHETMNNYKP